MDTELLHKLSDEKWQHETAKVKAEGHTWVHVIPRLDYAARAEYGRVETTYRAPTDEEAAALADLKGKRQALAEAAESIEDDEEGVCGP